MKHFPLPLDGKFCPDGKFKLDSEFIFEDPEKDLRVVVPTGFVTDFNSVPRALWTYFAPTDHLEAGVVHDWLYKHPGERSRQVCDDIHRRILHLKGVRLTKRNTIYLALRAGGWVPWDRYRAQDIVGQASADHNSDTKNA